MKRMVLMTYTPRELDEAARCKRNLARWTADWSRHGSDHPDQSENLKISFCEDYWG